MGLFQDIALLISGGDSAGADVAIDRYAYAVSGLITETAGAGTFTLTLPVPAKASIIDVIVDGIALWDHAGACSLIVGDGDDDNGFFVATDLKATDLLAGESFSLSLAGGKVGAYVANAQASPRYSAAARNVIAVVTAASTGGTAGRTRVTVLYALTGATVAAVKV
jgi:hypothetical protein